MQFLQPQTVQEACDAYIQEAALGNNPLWFSGGTEVVSSLRKNTLKTNTLIDLKKLPEFLDISDAGDRWRIGAGATLNAVLESPVPPMLKAVLEGIADHTIRNRLTIGGNLCGRLPYREAVLPLLAMNASVVIASVSGSETRALEDQFNRNINLTPGSFLMAIEIPKTADALAWGASRKVRLGPIDYPLVHVLLTGPDDCCRLHISGLCPYPVSMTGLNQMALTQPDAIPLPAPVQSDKMASSQYRMHLFSLALAEARQHKEARHDPLR